MQFLALLADPSTEDRNKSGIPLCPNLLLNID
jgi:hypothetical protein